MIDLAVNVLSENPVLAILFALAPGVLIITVLDMIEAFRGNGSMFDPPIILYLNTSGLIAGRIG